MNPLPIETPASLRALAENYASAVGEGSDAMRQEAAELRQRAHELEIEREVVRNSPHMATLVARARAEKDQARAETEIARLKEIDIRTAREGVNVPVDSESVESVHAVVRAREALVALPGPTARISDTGTLSRVCAVCGMETEGERCPNAFCAAPSRACSAAEIAIRAQANAEGWEK